MKDRYKKGALMATCLGLVVATSPIIAVAQDVDPYHAFILELLEGEYGITGGEFVLGTDAQSVLDRAGAWGSATSEVRAGNPSEMPFFDYIHYDAVVGANAWASGANVTTTQAVEEGETGLFVALMRGERTEGGEAEINIHFERSQDPWDKNSMDQRQTLNSDWNIVIVPFSFSPSFGPGQAQMGMHLAVYNQWVETTPVVVLNYGDKYSPAVLEGMIASGGGTPTVAAFSASATSGPVPLEVTFDASGSTSAGTITNYAWNFGDQGTASGQTASFTFEEKGVYVVTLTITDSNGATNSTTRTIMVTALEGSLQQPLEIPFTEVAPVIDGAREAAWDAAKTVSIENHVADQLPANDDDLSGTASVMWDQEYLYVLYEVNDEALFNDTGSPSGWNTYQDDAVDFYLDGGNTKATAYDLATTAQLEFGYDTLGVTGKGPLATSQDVYAWAETETGYNIEARVPWDSFSVAAAHGTIIGIEFMINDDDTGGNVRQTKLAWFGLVDEAWQNPSHFGNAILVGGSVSAERGDELPEQFAIESVYPNPFNPSTTVSVQLQELGDYTVRAFNLLGQQVLEKTFTASTPGRIEVQLTFDALASGIYTVNVQHKLSGKAATTTAVLLK